MFSFALLANMLKFEAIQQNNQSIMHSIFENGYLRTGELIYLVILMLFKVPDAPEVLLHSSYLQEPFPSDLQFLTRMPH